MRHSGLDITVYSSDTTRSAATYPGKARPCSAGSSTRPRRAGNPQSPDHAYCSAVKARLGGQRATISVARKLARRCHHTLRKLGD